MKIIIYALGRIFEQCSGKINWEHIEALCDKEAESKRASYREYGVPVISPDMLCEMGYDFVAVFSNVYFEEIRQELVGRYFVPRDKVITWREIVEENAKSKGVMIPFCKSYFKDNGYKRFLDIGMNVLPKRYLTKTELCMAEPCMGEDIVLDGIVSEAAEFNVNLYDKVYKNSSAITDDYDVAFLWDEQQYSEEDIHLLTKHTKNIILSKRRENDLDIMNMKERFRQAGQIKCISTVDGDFWIISTKAESVKNDVAIYVVTHKNYNLYLEKPYIPLCVGEYQKEGYLTEKTGDNIAYLNKRINECTALYWIWKNTDSKYVGLNHYRRYFYNNEIESMDNYLDLEHLNGIFCKYDIILPKTYPIEQMTMLEQIEASMNSELCQKGYQLIRKKIKENQPEYLSAFDSVMNSHVIFNCNIFVTKREILNQYCEWLFSFLIEAAEEIEVEDYDSYSQRVIGFFAERMWTVWLRKNRLRIKELPYTIIR